MKVYAGMDPRLDLTAVIAHAQRVEALGYDGIHVAETIHDSLALALLIADTPLASRCAQVSPWPSPAVPR